MRAVRAGLRSTARALGAVRDLDVLIENAQAFKDSLPEEQQQDMSSLLDDWDSKRRKVRKAMMRLLRSKDYSRFKRRMDSFLEEESTPLDETAGAQPHQVRHVAGSAILIKYEAVRAFETLMEAPSVEQLHALRIAGKYLRYTLECFREALSPQSGNLIKDVTKMQDQLGILHDADVAAILIRDHIASQAGKAKRRNEEYEVPAGLAAYLNDRETTVRRCHEEFFPTWSKLMSHAWRARLAAVITQI
jgi:CHAD domain-containing protein